MKVSEVGCGYLGAVHAAAMAALGREVVGVDVDEPKIAMLGAGSAPFEPGLPEILKSALASDRLRFSTQVSDVRGQGATVVATDPRAVPNSRKSHPQLSFEPDLDTAVSTAEVTAVLTEWDEFRQLDPERFPGKSGRTVIDGRNCLDSAKSESAGWNYVGMGRMASPPHKPMPRGTR